MSYQEPSARREDQGVQEIDPQWLGNWLKAIQQEQQRQTKYLKNISTVATIIGLLLILAMVFGGCSLIGF